MIDRLPGLDASANFGSRDAERKAFQRAAVKGFWKGNLHLSRARHHHELRELRQLFRVAPGWELLHMIAADEVKDFRLGKALMEIAQRADGVGNAAALKLLLVDFAPGFSREREPQQAEAVGAGSGFAVRFEGRLGGRDEEEAVQLQFLARGLRH